MDPETLSSAEVGPSCKTADADVEGRRTLGPIRDALTPPLAG
jgi:hypothetical protein